jgi:hypothetical protein
MQKTRKWIVLFVLYVFVVHIADNMLYASYDMDSLDFVDFWDFSYLDTIESFVGSLFVYGVESGYVLPEHVSEDLVFAIAYSLDGLWGWIVWLGSIALIIYYMFKWTSSYNLEKFGHKSRRDWERANNYRNKYVGFLTDFMKSFYSNGSNLATSGKSATSALKQTARHEAPKIAHGAKTLAKKNKEFLEKLRGTGTSDDVINQIRKYHDLLELGVISESEFAAKKRELLG